MEQSWHAAQELLAEYQQGENRFLSDLAETKSMLELKHLCKKWTDNPTSNIRHIVLIGVGGSILSPSLFMPFARHNFHIHPLVTPDASTIYQLLYPLDPAQTRFVILSKSGKTAETLVLFLFILDWLERAGLAPSDAMIIVCEDSNHALNRFSKAYQIPTVYSDKDINSRFSLFTAIGMFPACLFGLDGEAIRKSAKSYFVNFFEAIENHIPHDLIQATAFNAWGQATGKNIHVMMSTDPRLVPLIAWWQQIFAESLGKNDKAMSPLCATLPNDLHVQFQLYLDGPDDKIFTCLTGLLQSVDQSIHVRDEKSLSWLEGQTLDQLMLGQEHIALKSLARKRRAVRILALEPFTEASYGALLIYFILEVLLLAKLWGISAFGQPAIEQGKIDLVDFMREGK